MFQCAWLLLGHVTLERNAKPRKASSSSDDVRCRAAARRLLVLPVLHPRPPRIRPCTRVPRRRVRHERALPGRRVLLHERDGERRALRDARVAGERVRAGVPEAVRAGARDEERVGRGHGPAARAAVRSALPQRDSLRVDERAAVWRSSRADQPGQRASVRGAPRLLHATAAGAVGARRDTLYPVLFGSETPSPQSAARFCSA